MKKWNKFINSEAKYLIFFALTGIIVAVLNKLFGFSKLRILYHFVNHILRTLVHLRL